MQTLNFDVTGMICGGCTGSVQRALSKLDGVSHAEVTLQPGVATLVVDPDRVIAAQVELVIAGLGYRAKARPAARADTAEQLAKTGSGSTVELRPRPMQPSGRVFFVSGLWLIALGLYFLFLRPALLPEDPAFIGNSLEAIRTAIPGLERWLSHVFTVMGGFMIAVGAVTTFLARRFLSRREPGTFVTMLVVGAASVALMSATNFLLHSNFRWLLLLPALLWLVGLLCYLRENAAPDKRVHSDGEA